MISNVSGVVSVIPRSLEPDAKLWTIVACGLASSGLIRYRSGVVSSVVRMEPQERTARFSTQVGLGNV